MYLLDRLQQERQTERKNENKQTTNIHTNKQTKSAKVWKGGSERRGGGGVLLLRFKHIVKRQRSDVLINPLTWQRLYCGQVYSKRAL